MLPGRRVSALRSILVSLPVRRTRVPRLKVDLNFRCTNVENLEHLKLETCFWVHGFFFCQGGKQKISCCFELKVSLWHFNVCQPQALTLVYPRTGLCPGMVRCTWGRLEVQTRENDQRQILSKTKFGSQWPRVYLTQGEGSLSSGLYFTPPPPWATRGPTFEWTDFLLRWAFVLRAADILLASLVVDRLTKLLVVVPGQKFGLWSITTQWWSIFLASQPHVHPAKQLTVTLTFAEIISGDSFAAKE